jgi:transposase-like protein
MGYRGKVKEQEKARALRAQNRTIADIARTLGVSKSSVSLWVRDVPFTPTLRLRGPHRRPHPAHEAKLRQIADLNREGRKRLGVLSDEALFAAGVALYAGEGSKTDGEVRFSNSDPKMVRLFCMWFRRFFIVDEKRMHGRLYLHEGLDLTAAETFWSGLANIPTTQFHKPYRAAPDPSIRRNKHEHGCFSVGYACSRTHREVMGLVRALLSSEALPG